MVTNESPKLLVFLGNAGARYARTRHNAGWMLLDRFCDAGNWQRKFKAVWTRFTIAGNSVLFLKPQTMMNLSGESVQAAMRYFRYAPDQVVVAHDDVELAFGQVGIRMGGGPAGHNGLRSVANCLSTRDFWRLRIGVGRPSQGDLHDHVLGRFSPEEEIALPGILNEIAALVEAGVRSGFNEILPKDIPMRR
ncbi:MAG: aminoacyl-tRNA hydrolase [Spirochaetia bacterium]